MTIVRTCLAIVLGAATNALAQPTVFSNFDEGADGWVAINGGDVVWLAEGGHPGGFLQVTDVPLPPGSYEMVAPAKFLGDIRGFDLGRLQWDARTIEATLFNWVGSYGRVFIVGGNGEEVSFDPVPAGIISTAWTTYTADLSAEKFGVTQEEFDAVLADVTEIRIRLEAYDDDDVMGFDTVLLERCKADVNEDKELNIFDFVAFQVGFNAGDTDTDINSDGQLNVFDFVAFQAAFIEGCG